MSLKADSQALFFTLRKILKTSVQHTHFETTVNTSCQSTLPCCYRDCPKSPPLMSIALPMATHRGCPFPFLSGSHTPPNIFSTPMFNTNPCVLCISPYTSSTSPIANNSIICASTSPDCPGPFANTSNAQHINTSFPVEVEAAHYVYFSHWFLLDAF